MCANNFLLGGGAHAGGYLVATEMLAHILVNVFTENQVVFR